MYQNVTLWLKKDPGSRENVTVTDQAKKGT